MDVAVVVSQALAIAAFSITLTRAKVMAPLRERSRGKLRDLLHCPYCISHWAALAITALTYEPLTYAAPLIPQMLGTGLRFGDYVIYGFALVGLSALIIGAIFRLLLWQENRIEDLERDLNKAKAVLATLAEEP